jgi:hypothetical protein
MMTNWVKRDDPRVKRDVSMRGAPSDPGFSHVTENPAVEALTPLGLARSVPLDEPLLVMYTMLFEVVGSHVVELSPTAQLVKFVLP